MNTTSKLVEVRNLAIADKAYFDEVKKYEDSKKKNYTCVVWASKTVTDEDIEKINKVSNLEVIQKTPLRVLHRRTLIDRKKTIFSLGAKRVNENFLIVDVEASAGTYIKEFIHSDLGRTVPNLGLILGYECDIIQLDVADIKY